MTTQIDVPAKIFQPPANRFRLRLRRILAAGLLLLLGLCALTWLAGTLAKAKLTQQFPPPGKRVDVGGYPLHLDCLGQGSPTVILEAGLNDFSVFWASVQPGVSAFTRVCAYDRAGLGWSEPSPYPRTSEQIVDELHMLLTNANIHAPYLLVGHSFGGVTMRRFAQRYANEVVGMVLVDSAHEEQGKRIPTQRDAVAQLTQQFRLLAVLSEFGLLALTPEQIPNRGLPSAALVQYRAVLATTDYFQAAILESEAFATAGASAATAAPATFGDLPLVVMRRGQPAPLPGLSAAENEEYEQIWQTMQTELAALSSNSQQIVAEHSGHDIHLQQPELVIEAIRQLVQTAQ